MAIRSRTRSRAAPAGSGTGTVAYLRKSTNPRKKFQVTVVGPSGRRTVHFGGVREDGEPYRDFTMHKDPETMRRYLARHRAREDWTIGGIGTAGFWARWLLWSKPTLRDAIALTERTFGIEIRRGAPPAPRKAP